MLSSAVLSPERRSANIDRATSAPLDVVVVGGGVVGAGSALDAASRGLSTALVEAQDWGAGTSSRSSKLVHGGLRYLQMMDFGLVRQALKERGLLLQHLAPHLVHPVPVLYPLRQRVTERAYVGAGIALYDLIGWSSRTTRGLPLHRHLSKRAALAVAPGLRRDSLVGAVEYYDAQVDDARYVCELVRSAASFGAMAMSRMTVTGFLRDGMRVVGVHVRDAETGAEHDLQARVTVLATGAWTEETEALAGRERVTLVRPSKGIHLVVPRTAIPSSVALILRTEKSVLFVLPWGEHWLIGTTDTDWDHEKARPVATASDVDYLLEEVNTILERPLSDKDVEAVFAGLRPLVAGVGVVRGPGESGGTRREGAPKAEATTTLSREHAVGRPVPGLVVVSGGKYTTYRVIAADAVNAAVSEGGFRDVPSSLTDETPLIGAAGYKAFWNQRRRLAESHGLSLEAIEHLLHRFGGLVEEVLALLDAEPSLASPLSGAREYLRAEIVHSVTHEDARHLEDILLRRTRIGIETRDGGTDSAEEVADLVAGLLNWSDVAKSAELEDYRRQVSLNERATSLHSDDEAARLVVETPSLLPLP